MFSIRSNSAKLFLGLVLVLCGFYSSNKVVAQNPTLDLGVDFTGPWAFVQTPAGIVAISPSSDHLPGKVQGTSGTPLVPGVYNLGLSNPRPGVLPSGAKTPIFVPGKTTTAQLATLTKAPPPKPLGRYALFLPPGGVFELPVADESSEEASVSDYFEPFAPSPQNYAKHVRIHYTVSDLSIVLSGTADTGNWGGPFRTNGPITVSVDPLKGANFFCDYHPRLAFMDLNALLAAGLFVDFPNYTQMCRDNWDPQKPYPQLAAFQAVAPPDPTTIDVQPIILLVNVMQQTTRELLPTDSEAQQTYEDVKAYVKTWSTGGGNESKDKELGKQLKRLLDELRNGSDESHKVHSKRVLLEREVELLSEVVMTGGPSGRNCKAPMMSVTVSSGP
jgi:hypothetical protein